MSRFVQNEVKTESYWLNSPAMPHSITEYDIIEESPNEVCRNAEVIIIGGGIAGVSTAYHLGKRNVKCIILEKGSVCAGATGCNGGMLVPGPSEGFSDCIARHGLDVALSINEYTHKCARDIQAFVEEGKIDCEMRFPGLVNFAYTLEELVEVKKSYDVLLEHGVDVDWWTASDCLKHTKCSDFLGGYHRKYAGQLWPAKLVHGILEAAIELGTVVHTHVVVTGVTMNNSSDEFGVSVETMKHGVFRAKKVVYATNAWTSELLPHLKDIIVPVRNQVVMTEPAPPMWAFGLMANYGFEYWHQRHDGRIILGGMRNLTPTKEYCNKDTTSLDAEVSAALRTYLSLHFPDLASIKIEYEWAGIMGFSKDRNPLVGMVNESTHPNQYIIAGFTGHGMPIAFSASSELADMICGAEYDPKCIMNQIYKPSRFDE